MTYLIQQFFIFVFTCDILKVQINQLLKNTTTLSVGLELTTTA